MKTLGNISLDFLIGRCNLSYIFDASRDHTLSMYCLIDEFLVASCEKTFWFCQCPRYCYDSEMKKRCDWCTFYSDMFTFCHEFNDLTSRSKIFKIINVFTLYIRIIGYWLSVNSKFVNDFLIYCILVVIVAFKMGSIHSRREKVKIKNMLPRGSEFSHLNKRGEILLRRDQDFDILCFEIKFERYFLTVVRLRPSNHPTSVPTPNVSSTDDISDSGADCQ